MKLRKLIIHNIASIQDAAIDFESAPLCDSDVFLISGETGSGKTTIPDAICLALYGTTPRMKNTRMEGAMNGIDETTQIKDPAQMLRRNTGEGFVRLTFTGNNGTGYEAEWSIRRARNRATGRLQGRTHTLMFTDAAGRRQILSKERERTDEILRATGHSFEQFCRTTMLAQGDFARFLNSKDHEKAEILERITSAYIYADIGSRTFAITRDKKAALDDALRRKGDINLLTPEQTETLQQTITECDRIIGESSERRTTLTTALNWLNERDTITRRLTDASATLDEATKATQTDDYQTRTTLVARWQATDHARTLCRQIRTATADKVKVQRHMATLIRQYQTVESGYRYLHDAIGKLQNTITDTRRDIDADSTRAAIYEVREAITAHLENISAKTDALNKASKAADRSRDIIAGPLADARVRAEDALTAADTALTECRDTADTLQKRLDDTQLSTLRRTLTDTTDTISNIKAARTRLETYVNHRQRHDEDLRQLEQRAAALADTERMLTAAETEEQAASRMLDAATQSYTMHLSTVDKWAKAMRARLDIDDTCPVCRQRITHKMPDEDELDTLFRLSEKALEEATQRHRLAHENADRLRADIKARREQLDTDRRRITADKTVGTSLEAATAACRLCGIDNPGDDSDSRLIQMLEDATSIKAQTELRIADAETIAKELTACRATLDSLVTKKELASKAVNDARTNIAEETSRMNEAIALTRSHTADISASRSEVTRLLGDTTWEHDALTDSEQFITELRDKARRYDTLVSSLATHTAALTLMQSQYEIVKDSLDETTAACHELTEAEHIPAAEVTDIVSTAAQLRTDIISARELIAAADNTIATATSGLDTFIRENPGMTHELIAALDQQYDAASIRQISNRLQQLADTLKEATARHSQLAEQLAAHNSGIPAILTTEESPTTESLTRAIADIDNTITVSARRRGETEQQLTLDREQRTRLSTILAEIERLRTEHDRWAHLNDLIGDANGNKFRKIAQSLVLADLIASANRYMHLLSDRYTLHVEPGTFVISVEDAYQGYTRRPASTISGGETFLVSLALALALSDIGNGLTADTLFIDEGFGTLSGAPLQRAIDTLRVLHRRAGRHVGIISHVEELRERIPTQIVLTRQPNSSSSTVTVI